MGSNFQYTIDLNENQNHQPNFGSPLGSSLLLYHHHFHHQAPFNPSSSTSPSLSYLPFSINSHQDQAHLGYNNNTFHGVLDPNLAQPLEIIEKFVSNGGSSSNDQMVPKKETRLNLTIRKKDNYQEQTNLPQYPTKGNTGIHSLKWISSKVRMMKKKTIITITNNSKKIVNKDQFSNLSNLEGVHHDHLKKTSANQYNTIMNCSGSKDCVIRICSDCNTTKTPLWRSGPRGPKSLCNACGIRQRKARGAAMAAAAATATTASEVSLPLLKKKMQNTNKISNGVYNLSSPSAPKVNKCKRMITLDKAAVAGNMETQRKSTMLSSSSTTPSSSDNFYFDDLAIILSKSSAYRQVFPQDEKEAAILLMALSYGMVHG